MRGHVHAHRFRPSPSRRSLACRSRRSRADVHGSARHDHRQRRLRYISGGLSAAVTDSEWVITSYLAANAIVLPISGWLSSHLGRRNYFLLSIAVFTLASALCGLATSLWQMILFRVMQGLAGGGLQPSSQGILLDSFPKEKQGTALTLFGIAALIAPIVGPALGGWLCVNYDWRWIFLINVPVGIVALVASYLLVERSGISASKSGPSSAAAAAIRLHRPGTAGARAVVLGSDSQQGTGVGLARRSVLANPDAMVVLMVVGLACLVVWELRIRLPSSTSACSAIAIWRYRASFCFARSPCCMPPASRCRRCCRRCLATTPSKPGLVLSPAGISSMCALIMAGVLLARGVDARWLVAAGLLVMATSNYWMSQMNLEISPGQVVAPRMVLTAGLGLIIAPISVAAYMYIPPHLRGAAIGLASLLRNEGGSVGTSWPRQWKSAASSSTPRESASFSILSTHWSTRLSSKVRRSSSSTPAIR